MKKILYTLFFFPLFQYSAQAQNLVANPSFDTYTSLPNAYGQYARSTGWTNCGGSGTADYYHTSGTTPTGFGPMTPRSGGGQMGFLTRHSTAGVAMEYVCRTLSSAMTVGQAYEVSFYLTRGTGAGLYPSATGNIGAYFSVGLPVQPGTGIIAVTPQVEQVGIVNVVNTWQLYTFTFTATAAFNSISIGNFHTFAATPYSGGDGRAYYFIDDILVRPIVLLQLDLRSFDVVKKDGDKSAISWQFEHPEDIVSVDIQRSFNGVEFDVLYSNLDPEAPVQIDATPFLGNNYYRLRTLKYDGTVAYSDIKVLNFEKEGSLFLAKIYPNPFQDWLVLDFQNIDKEEKIQIELHDVLGRKIYEETQIIPVGHSKIELGLSGKDLAAGTYLLSFSTSAGIRKQYKLVRG